jgi:hypothetical protein
MAIIGSALLSTALGVAGTAGGVAAFTFLGMTGFTAVFASFLVSTAMGAALNALSPKPNTSATRGYSISGESGAAIDHQIIYGEAKVGGVRVYDTTTGGSTNTFLHRILVFAGHEIDSYVKIYVNNDEVTINGSNDVTAPAQYVKDGKSYIHIKKYYGTAGQTVDTELDAATSEWSSAHKLSGLAYLYIRFEYNSDVFPNGVPAVSAVIKGKKVYDPRTATTKWSQNPALCLRDYLTQDYGLGVPTSRVSDTHVTTAANICDQAVTSTLNTPITTTGASGTGSVATLTFAAKPSAPFAVGSTITVSGVTPTGYNGTFIVTACTTTSVSYAKTTTGAQTVAGKVGSDIRYTCNGAFVTAFTPNQVISDIITSMGGLFWYSQGEWRMKASAYTTPTITLTEDDLRSSVSVSTRHSRRDTFNTVKGKFKGAESDWQEADYPQVISTAAISADNNIINTADYSLPFTTSSITAQRIAKIFLFRNREQLTVTASFGLKAFEVEVGDIVNLSLARFGWLPKTFEITNWSFGLTEGLDLQVNLTLREISSQVFDDVDGSVFETNNSTLPSAFAVSSVGLEVTSETTIGFESLINTLYATISASDASSVERVEVQYKLHSDTVWSAVGVGDLGIYQVTGVADGMYDVRARAYSYLGIKSDWNTRENFQVATTAASPDTVTNFSYNLSGGTVGLQWTPVSNLDLSYYRIRHSNSETGATWSDAVTAIDKISRPATSINAPVKSGTYMIRAYNKSAKTSSSFASLVVPSTNLETFTTNTNLTDSPTFTGTKTNTSVTSSALRLTTYTGASSTGTYNFSTYIDTTTARRVRTRVDLQVVRFSTAGGLFDNLVGLFDSQSGLFDDLTGFSAYEDIDVVTYISTTPDNPAGTPTWSAYQPFVAGDFYGRAFRFRVELKSYSPNVTPSITSLIARVQYN